MKATSLLKALSLAALTCVAVMKAEAADRLPIEALTSPNGTAYWFMPVEKAKRTAVMVAWPSDLSIVPAGKEGAALLATQLMMYGGAGGLGPDEVAAAFNDLDAGARIVALPHELRAFLVAPDDTALEAASQLNTALRDPAFDETWLQRIRGNILKTRLQKGMTAGHRMWAAARTAIMGDSRYRRALLFDPQSVLTSVTRQDIVKWHRAAFTRENAIVVAAGSAGSELTGQAIDRLLENLPARPAAPAVPAAFPRIKIPGKTIVLHDPASPKSSIVMVGRVPPGTEEGGYKRLIATTVLGNSPDSRLFTQLRTELGLTYRVKVGVTDFGRTQRVMTIGGEFESAKLEQALRAIRDTYRAFRRGGVTADEFSVVKRRLLRNLKKRLLDPTGTARFLIALRTGGLDLGYVTGLAPSVETLTREDLNAYIAERLPPLDEMLTVIVTPNVEGIVADCVVTSPASVDGCLGR